MNHNLAFDIGANKGNVIKLLVQKGFKKIVGIEANPSTYKKACKRFKNSECITLLNNLVSTVSGNMMDFWINEYNPISTASRKFMETFSNDKHKKWKIGRAHV